LLNFDAADLGMESDEVIASAVAQLATATMAQIASDRERLKKLWVGLNQTESVIRRGQLAISNQPSSLDAAMAGLRSENSVYRSIESKTAARPRCRGH
jgi:hypothetical protein